MTTSKNNVFSTPEQYMLKKYRYEKTTLADIATLRQLQCDDAMMTVR
jgi:hypothetical protein